MGVLNIIAFCCVVTLTCGAEARNEHILALYSNNQYELVVTDTELAVGLKAFTVQVKSCSGVTIIYGKDLIFFSGHEGTIYRIHLVDGKGNRKISGNGTLYTDESAEHFEMAFFDVGNPIIDLAYDKKHELIYAISQYAIFIIDPNADPDEPDNILVSKIQFSNTLKGKHAVLSNGMLYIADSHNLYSVPLAALAYSPRLTVLAKFDTLTSFTIDSKTSKLYYVSRNVMRVIAMNATGDTPIDQLAIDKRRVVIANSQVTKGVYSMAVYGDVVVWSSCPWRELYIGKLNYKRNFIPIRNVKLIDNMVLAGDETDEDDADDDEKEEVEVDDCMGFHNINLFLHNYDGDEDDDGDDDDDSGDDEYDGDDGSTEEPPSKLKKTKATKISKRRHDMTI